MNEQDKNLVLEASKMKWTDWRKIDDLISKASTEDVKVILRSFSNTYQNVCEFRDLYFSKI